MAEGARARQTFAHQGQADAEILALRMHRQGSEQQRIGSVRANLQRPEADGAGQTKLSIADHQREFFGRLRPLAQAVGGLGPARQAKTQIEQEFDQGFISGHKVIGGKGRGWHGSVPETGEKRDP